MTSLKKRTVKNVGIVMLIKVINSILNVVTLAILARLLFPSDFGIVVVGTLVIAIFVEINELGIRAAVIHRSDKIEEALHTGAMLRWVATLPFLAAILFFAPQFAGFFNVPEASTVIQVLSIVLVIDTLGFVSTTRLTKNLEFKKLAYPALAKNLTTVTLAVALAYVGFSYWSLVYGNIIGAIVWLIVLYAVSPWKPKFVFDKEVAKDIIRYSKYVYIAQIFVFLYFNIDDAVIGRVLGVVMLGFYAVAYSWGTLPGKTMRFLHGVMFPTYARIKDDIARLKKWYLETLRYISMATFPMAFGLIIIASDFVLLILHKKWEPSIIPLQILCLYGITDSINLPSGSLIMALGKTSIAAKQTAFTTTVLMILIYPAVVTMGIVGGALVVLLAGVISNIWLFSAAKKLLGITWSEIARNLYKQLLASVSFAAVIFILKFLLAPSLPVLALYVILGVVIYFVVMYFITKREILREVKEIWSLMR
jgi:O-antigen/teichoic acid export membrane protein